ncbi:hypothetical protein BDV12DRAFT_20067 [Aspergillus spectabilis]
MVQDASRPSNVIPYTEKEPDTRTRSQSEVESKESGGGTASQTKKTADKHSVDHLLRSGLAGGIAGVAGKTTIAPLDRVKILFQTRNPHFEGYIGSWTGFGRALRHIVRHEGSQALFRGHSATILRIFPYAGIRFLSYESFRGTLIPNKERETPGRRFLAGSVAGVVSVVGTYPLELLRVRLAFITEGSGNGARRSLLEVAREINRERRSGSRLGGIANFYRGFCPTILGMIPYAGTSFLAHDVMGDILRHSILERWTCTRNGPDISTTTNGKRLRWWAELIAGGSAGLAAQTVSYTFEVIRRRLQVQVNPAAGIDSVGNGVKRLQMREVARLIFAERGFSGFFVGLGIGYIKIVPMFAVTFFVYGRVRGWLGV